MEKKYLSFSRLEWLIILFTIVGLIIIIVIGFVYYTGNQVQYSDDRPPMIGKNKNILQSVPTAESSLKEIAEYNGSLVQLEVTEPTLTKRVNGTKDDDYIVGENPEAKPILGGTPGVVVYEDDPLNPKYPVLLRGVSVVNTMSQYYDDPLSTLDWKSEMEKLKTYMAAESIASLPVPMAIFYSTFGGGATEYKSELTGFTIPGIDTVKVITAMQGQDFPGDYNVIVFAQKGSDIAMYIINVIEATELVEKCDLDQQCVDDLVLAEGNQIFARERAQQLINLVTFQ